MTAPTSYGDRLATILNLKFPGYTYAVKSGRKYDKITVQHSFNGGQSVHAFVNRENGDVLKAEGWNKPAQGARGNVATFEGLKDITERADKFGGYLYR